MQFHVFKIISAVILLNTTVCLAMESSREENRLGIEIESINCQGRIYDGPQIALTIFKNLEKIHEWKMLGLDLNAIKYRPQPTEEMPFPGLFFPAPLDEPKGGQYVDLIIYSYEGKFAKAVTKIQNGRETEYKECVSTRVERSPPMTGSPQQRRPMSGSPQRRRPMTGSPQQRRPMTGPPERDSFE